MVIADDEERILTHVPNLAKFTLIGIIQASVKISAPLRSLQFAQSRNHTVS